MVDSQDFENQVQQLKSLPQYSGMSDDMIRQMILKETPQQNTPLTSGDFGISMDNQINYGSTGEYPMMSANDFNVNTQSPKGFDLGETLGNLKNIYKNIGNKGQAHVKDILGIMPEASVAEKAIQAGEMTGPSLANAGLQMSNIGKAVPVGTSGLSSLLGKIGIGGGGAGAGAGAGAGGALAGLAPALPFLAVGAGLLALKAKKKKKKLKQKMKAEKEYRERKFEQKQELIDANVEYMQTAQQYNNPYKID